MGGWRSRDHPLAQEQDIRDDPRPSSANASAGSRMAPEQFGMGIEQEAEVRLRPVE